VVEELEEATRRFAKRLQARARADKRKEYEKAYAPRRADVEKVYAPRRAEINKAYAPRRAEIDKARGLRRSGRRINNRPAGGMIVGVDLEGVNLGAPFILDDKGFKTRISLSKNEIMKWVEAGETVYRDQRACTAKVGGVEDKGYKDQIRRWPDGASSENLIEALLEQPRIFASKDPKGMRPRFIGFGFDYDDGQILKDLPYDKLWELQKGVRWKDRHNPNARSRRGQWTPWRDKAVSVIPGKSIKFARLRDRSAPWKWRVQKDGSLKRYLDYVEKIEIEDAFGFFQKGLVEAIKSMPKDLIVSENELAAIVSGKKGRGYLERAALTPEMFDQLKGYTGAELKALVRMVEETERALIEADAESRAADLKRAGTNQAAIHADLEKRFKLLHLHGAGAAAQALLKVRLPSDPRPLLGNVAQTLRDLDALVSAVETAEPELKRDEGLKQIALDPFAPPGPRALVWSTYAYFGGRIEAPMQGKTRGRLFSSDISSAYPAQIAKLPSMAGGRWRQVSRPTREEVISSSMPSMFRAKTLGFPLTLPIYPLPWRTKAGAVVYPHDAYGIWMRDEVVGLFEFHDRFRRGEIEVIEGLIFEPADPCSRPFAWVSSMFDYRARLFRADKKDVRATSIKLELNSLYGKLAQGVGGSEEPPRFASPWMAAAVTAGTRLQLLRAALTKPDKIVSFATDAIYSKSPLAIPTSAPGEKELGVWEATKTIRHGGVFVLSGVAHMVTDKNDKEDGAETKTRGFNPANYGDRDADPKARIAKIMLEEIPAAWEADKPEFKFPYQQYMGLGGSVQARFTESVIGTWKLSLRTVNLNGVGSKRFVPAGEEYASLRRSRAKKLIPLDVRSFGRDMPPGELSAPAPPDWMNQALKNAFDMTEEDKNVLAGFSAS
jgi:DNA polymerase type B, organellar and viral